MHPVAPIRSVRRQGRGTETILAHGRWAICRGEFRLFRSFARRRCDRVDLSPHHHGRTAAVASLGLTDRSRLVELRGQAPGRNACGPGTESSRAAAGSNLKLIESIRRARKGDNITIHYNKYIGLEKKTRRCFQTQVSYRSFWTTIFSELNYCKYNLRNGSSRQAPLPCLKHSAACGLAHNLANDGSNPLSTIISTLIYSKPTYITLWGRDK